MGEPFFPPPTPRRPKDEPYRTAGNQARESGSPTLIAKTLELEPHADDVLLARAAAQRLAQPAQPAPTLRPAPTTSVTPQAQFAGAPAKRVAALVLTLLVVKCLSWILHDHPFANDAWLGVPLAIVLLLALVGLVVYRVSSVGDAIKRRFRRR